MRGRLSYSQGLNPPNRNLPHVSNVWSRRSAAAGDRGSSAASVPPSPSNRAQGRLSIMSALKAAPRRRRRRWLWVALPIIAIAALGVGFLATSSQARAKNTLSTDDLDLRVGKASISDIQVTVNEVGTIEPV